VRPERTITAVAPLRIDLAGGPTDVPPYPSERGGAVINAAIAFHVRATVTTRSDGLCLVERIGATTVPCSMEDPALRTSSDLAEVAAAYFGPRSGVTIKLCLPAPAGSGMGTSSAVSAALAVALTAAAGGALPNAREIASKAKIVELACGITGGSQDQFAAALGGVNLLVFGAQEQVSVSRLKPPAVSVLQTGLIVHQGGSRASSPIVKRVIDAYKRGTVTVTDSLQRSKKQTGRLKDALERGDLTAVGECLTTIRCLQSALDEAIRDAIDQSPVMRLLTATPAWGKPLGAAGPGAAWFVLPHPGHKCELRDKASLAGFQVWPVIVAERGARLVRADQL